MDTKFIYVLFMCLWAGTSYAQPDSAFYWKGVSGPVASTADFNDPANWWLGSYNSGRTATQSPVSSNNVYFTAAAFASGSPTITISNNANCKDMIWDNAITTIPTLSASSSVELYIYGSLDIAPTMTWAVSGNIHFKSNIAGTVQLRTNGKVLRMCNLNIELGTGTTLQLADNLRVENPSSSNNTANRGWISLTSGHFHTNGKRVEADFFSSTGGNTSRRLTMDNSALIFDGVAWVQYPWRLDFSGTNYAGFSATGSHLRLQNATNYGGMQYLGFGSVVYDSISLEHQMTRLYMSSQNVTCNYFRIQSGLTPLIFNSSTITTNEFHIGAGATLLSQNTSRIVTDLIGTTTGCQTAILQAYNATLTLQKKTAGNLTFSNISLTGVTGDITGGRTYTANNSINANNNTNITINALSGCPTALWFRGTTTDWNNVNNWRDAPTGGNVPAAVPSLATDVYFDANSFTTVSSVMVAAPAFCQNMRWNGTPAGALINANTGGAGVIYSTGTLEFPANMGGVQGSNVGFELGRNFMMLGVGDSIITNGANIQGYLFFGKGSDYTIIDTLTANSIFQYHGSTLRMTNTGVRLNGYFMMGNRYLDNARIHIYGSGWNAINDVDNTVIQYTNNSTFYFNGSGTQMVAGTPPNVVVNNPLFYLNSGLTVRGNLTFNVSCQTSMQQYGNPSGGATQLNVQGDLTIAAGKEIVLRDGSPVIVGGNLNMIGNCNQITTVRTYNGSAINLTVTGSANIQYAYLQGLNSTSAITATNSINGGNNSNITFTTGTGTTYYWRADRTNSTDFVGDWTNPNHWTTNVASTIGDGACIPSLADNVIFDNLSFSGSSNGCVIDANAFCNNFTCTAGIRIQSPSTGVGSLFINGSYTLHSAVTWSHTGYIYMVGSGNINTAGKTLNIREFVLNNPSGTWTLQNAFAIGHSGLNPEFYGVFRFIAGTFNTNNYNVTISNRVEASGTTARSLVLGTSIWTMSMDGYYRYIFSPYYFPWNAQTSTNLTVSGGTIRFLDGTTRPEGKRLYMGAGITYNRIEITDTNEEIQIYNNSNYGYMQLATSAYVDGNNSFDSLYLAGGYTYRFKANATQTLNAPHGIILSGGSSTNFVFIESASPGSLTTFHKPYGSAFCIDFIKAKDLNGTRLATASAPVAYQPTQPFLEFQTGVNSDNVSNSTVGIWAFSLQPLVTPQYAGATSLTLCTYSSPSSIPVPITGTSPYLIQYSWSDGSTSGTGSVTVSDDDANPSTPYTHTLAMATSALSATYTFNVTTSRCGNPTVPTPRTVTVNRPAAAPLVSANRSATCTLYNEAVWHTFLDNTDKKPVVALLDQVNAGDVSALGSTTADVYFDGTQQYYNILGANYPYLKRHWKITPTNNGAARVRLFFTQAELNALAPYTFHGQYGGTLNPATNIQVLKFASGTIGVGGHTVVSHTVVPVTGSVAAPFSATSGVIAIEFDVTSFSHFIIVPNQSALLPLHLLSFDAKAIDNKAVKVDWTTAEDEDVRMYYVERSLNAIEGEIVGNVAPLNVRQETDYQLIDNNPYQGVSYYRVKAVKTDGSFTVSDWKAVTIEKGNDVAVYPNPANDAINLEIRADIQIANVRIIDVLGRVVYSAQWAAANGAIFSIPTQQLESGSYLIQVTDDANFSKQKRITIQH